MLAMARHALALRGAPGAVALVRERWRVDLTVAWRALWMSRLIVWVAGLVALAVWGESARASDFDPAGLTTAYAPWLDALVAPGARWDSVWFLEIAANGYDQDQRTAFFPLYPWLIQALGGGVLAALALSWACLLAALAVLHRLARLELGAHAARLAVIAIAVFPGSLFFSAAYSESLFLALSVGSVYAARTDRFLAAGVLGALAAATRSAGIVLLVALAILWWQRQGSLRDALALTLVPLGLAAFCGFLALSGQDAAAPFHAQQTWYREFAGPFGGLPDAGVAAWDGIRQLASGSRSPVYFDVAAGDPFAVAGHNISNLAFLAAAAAMLVGTFQRLGLAYGGYALACLALPLSYPVGPQPLMSLPRFVAVLFPLFMWLGWWLSRGSGWRRAGVIGVFTVGLVVFAAQFTTWHWVA